MANRQRNAERERFWRRATKRQAASGLSVRAFCRREGLNEPNFYAWRRTIALRDKQSSGALKPTQASKRPRQLAAFVPVVVTDGPPRETVIILELLGGRRLRLPDSMAVERLAQLVRAVEADLHTGEVTG